MLPEDHDALEALLAERTAAGFDNVPLALDSKSPNLSDWSHTETFHWPAFVGKNIGNRGTDVVAIDFDDPICAQIALHVFDLAFADVGGVVFDGRPSKPVSHIYVRVPDGAPRVDKASSPFQLTNVAAPYGVSGVTYCIEVKHHRGLQAMTAPSVHPGSGEALEWSVGLGGYGGHRTPVVPSMACAEVERLLRCVWLARALAGLWGEGRRHHLCLWVGTWLHQSGVVEADASLVGYGLLRSGVVATSDASGRLRDFMRDWAVPEGSRGHRGRGGVIEVVEAVHGTFAVPLWFDRVLKVWPELAVMNGPAVAGVAGGAVSASAGAGNGGSVWVPSGAEAELARMLRECTLIATGRGSGAVHDLSRGHIASLHEYRGILGRQGRESIGPRGGVQFSHLVDIWWEDRDKRVAQGVAYLPGHPYGKVVDGVVNTFRRGRVWTTAMEEHLGSETDVSPADVGWWLRWVERVIPDEQERRWFHLWVAHLLCFPERRPGWALYMIAPKEGMGRTSLAETLGLIMGVGNARPVSMSEIKSGYTAWAGESVLRYANEAREAGQWRGTIAAQLQETITDRVLGITQKYAVAMAVPNFGGYMLFSNSLSEVHIKHMSRRYCCINNDGELPDEAERREFFACQGDDERLVAVCRWYLQQQDEASELPARAPRTETFAQVVEASATDAEFLLAEAEPLMGGVFSMSQYISWEDHVLFCTGYSKSHLVKARNQLRAAGYVALRRVRRGEKQERVYVRAVDLNKYSKFTLEEINLTLDEVDKRLKERHKR